MLSATTLSEAENAEAEAVGSEAEKAPNVCSVGSGAEKAPKGCSLSADLNGALAIGRG